MTSALATHLRPQAYTALYLAGLRLDAAAAEFQRICSQQSRIADPMSDAEEIAFGRAESAYLAARDEYRRLLAETTGQDADEIERRLVA
jgi:hypothetical protein